MKVIKVEWGEVSGGRPAGPRTYNQTSRNLNSFVNSMKGAGERRQLTHPITQQEKEGLQANNLISFF